MAIFLIFLCMGLTASTPLTRLSSAFKNITMNSVEVFGPLLRPLLSRSEEIFKGSIKTDNGTTAIRVFGNAGNTDGRLPYSLFGFATGGSSLDFFGRIANNIRPFIGPLRSIASKAQRNSTSLVWSGSDDEHKS